MTDFPPNLEELVRCLYSQRFKRPDNYNGAATVPGSWEASIGCVLFVQCSFGIFNVRGFKVYLIFDNGQNGGPGVLEVLNTNSFCGRNFSNVLGSGRINRMMQASKSTVLKVKFDTDVQTLTCFF